MSFTGFKEYDADQIAMAVGLIPISGGWADGKFCSIKRVSAMFTDKAGTDGEVTRSKTNDRRAEVQISLMQSSDCNNLLSAVAILDENTSNGGGVGTCIIKDLSGKTAFFAAKAWISEMPESDFDREAGTRTWIIRCANAIWFVGGN